MFWEYYVQGIRKIQNLLIKHPFSDAEKVKCPPLNTFSLSTDYLLWTMHNASMLCTVLNSYLHLSSCSLHIQPPSLPFLLGPSLPCVCRATLDTCLEFLYETWKESINNVRITCSCLWSAASPQGSLIGAIVCFIGRGLPPPLQPQHLSHLAGVFFASFLKTHFFISVEQCCSIRIQPEWAQNTV